MRRIMTVQEMLEDIERNIALYGTPFPTAEQKRRTAQGEQLVSRCEDASPKPQVAQSSLNADESLEQKAQPKEQRSRKKSPKDKRFFIPRESWRLLCEVAHSFGVSMPKLKDTSYRSKRVVCARVAVVKKACELGLSKSEISEILELSVSCVSKLLRRAMTFP